MNLIMNESDSEEASLHEPNIVESQKKFNQGRKYYSGNSTTLYDSDIHNDTDINESERSIVNTSGEKSHNLSDSFVQKESDSESDDDNDDVCLVKSKKRHVYRIDSGDESYELNEPDLSESHKESGYSGNISRNTESGVLSDSGSDFDVKKSSRKHQNMVDSSDSEETYNLSSSCNQQHKASGSEYNRNSPDTIKDTKDFEQKIANISIELSKSRISDDEIDGNEKASTSVKQSQIKNSANFNEVADHTPISNRLKISEEFHFDNFGKVQNMMHSTLIEPQEMMNTPVNSSSGKRLLNKSVDTPRILKLSKESNTPRPMKPIIPSRSPSPESLSSSDDIIDISTDTEYIPRTPAKTSTNTNRIQKQTTLDHIFVKKESPAVGVKQEEFIMVSLNQYREQQDKINTIRSDIMKAQNLLRTVKLEHLPDKGKSIRNRHESLETMLLEEVKKMSQMKVTEDNQRDQKGQLKGKIEVLSWDEIETKAGAVQPRTFGKRAMSTYNAQKAVTMDRLQQLHGSLETCPKESDTADDPKGLNIELMSHQRRALAWLMWRETQKPSGGILADDMGLGKTLTMISLMLKVKETEKGNDDSDEETEEDGEKKRRQFKGGTLVVCPASLLNQWSNELERRTKRGLASCEIYHGAKRETKPKRLAQHDMVVTTYSIINNESDKNGAVFRVKWRRIVIDEAHQIRNHKSQTSEAVCKLSAKSRWALTGTPVHNKELDMYALFKFLRCSPFDDLAVWKRWVGDKSTGGTERLHTVISSLMLRRTKAELMEKGTLNSLPDRKWELIPVVLSKPERDVYSKILIFSRTLFAQFLHQRADKNTEQNFATSQEPDGPNHEYFHMRQKLLRMNNMRDIKQHEILVLLLRLRQICCHPSLITGMLQEDMELLGDADQRDDEAAALDLLDQLNKLTIDNTYKQNHADVAEGIGEEALGLREAARGVLNPSDPVFSKESMSSKIKAMIKVLIEKVIPNNDKAIIVSQWPSFLNLISQHLTKERIVYDQLDGTVPVSKRMTMVDKFNDPKDRLRLLLLSLTAGGVGLNLVGANHLFLLDLHWNPQLENQAQDRIYRMGQQKPVFVYKFMATDTIENRILELQEKKLSIANSMLTGTKQVISSKLTLQDLKMLFEM